MKLLITISLLLIGSHAEALDTRSYDHGNGYLQRRDPYLRNERSALHARDQDQFDVDLVLQRRVNDPWQYVSQSRGGNDGDLSQHSATASSSLVSAGSMGSLGSYPSSDSFASSHKSYGVLSDVPSSKSGSPRTYPSRGSSPISGVESHHSSGGGSGKLGMDKLALSDKGSGSSKEKYYSTESGKTANVEDTASSAPKRSGSRSPIRPSPITSPSSAAGQGKGKGQERLANRPPAAKVGGRRTTTSARKSEGRTAKHKGKR